MAKKVHTPHSLEDAPPPTSHHLATITCSAPWGRNHFYPQISSCWPGSPGLRPPPVFSGEVCRAWPTAAARGYFSLACCLGGCQIPLIPGHKKGDLH